MASTLIQTADVLELEVTALELDCSDDQVNEHKAQLPTFKARPLPSDEPWSRKALIFTVCVIAVSAILAGVVMVFQDKIKPESFFNLVSTVLAALLGYWVGSQKPPKD